MLRDRSCPMSLHAITNNNCQKKNHQTFISFKFVMVLKKRPKMNQFTKLEPAQNGVENVLVITDTFSKYTQAIPTRD